MPYRRPVNWFLSAFIVIGLTVLAILALISIAHTDSGRDAAKAAEENTRIAQQSADRTECIRSISNELDHAHWTLVGEAFNATSREASRAIGQTLASLPLTQDIANEGGSILGRHFDPCPPAPVGEGQ